jgi:hypothetical protein
MDAHESASSEFVVRRVRPSAALLYLASRRHVDGKHKDRDVMQIKGFRNRCLVAAVLDSGIKIKVVGTPDSTGKDA